MFQQILEQTFWGNRTLDYMISMGILLTGLVVIKICQIYVINRLKKWSKITATTLDDFVVGVVQKIGLPLSKLMVVYLSIGVLNLPPAAEKNINTLGMAVLTLFIARLLTMFVDYALKVYLSKRGMDASLERSLNGILRVAQVVIWGLAIVFFLDNLGFKISAVIAGLGIGGVAVALAAQAVLGDMFSYFSILFDRPFEIGDFIIVGDCLGTVEYTGIKTTRIRSLSGEQLIFSNTDLTNSRVRNYKRMDQRRVVFKLGVVYQTPLEKLKIIPGVIEKIIKSVKDTTFDRAHFFSYGDFSLVFEVVYYVIGSDYNKYMDINQEINFAIKKAFEEKGIEFAYPTQTLFLSKNAE